MLRSRVVVLARTGGKSARGSLRVEPWTIMATRAVSVSIRAKSRFGQGHPAHCSPPAGSQTPQDGRACRGESESTRHWAEPSAQPDGRGARLSRGTDGVTESRGGSDDAMPARGLHLLRNALYKYKHASTARRDACVLFNAGPDSCVRPRLPLPPSIQNPSPPAALPQDRIATQATTRHPVPSWPALPRNLPRRPLPPRGPSRWRMTRSS